MEPTSILIVGVGGQGTLLSSRVLGQMAADSGADVKLSEVHGMAQRGGSVVTHVRFGDRVYSPVIDRGQADVVIAFEKLEALRYLPYLKEGGRLYVSTQEIPPLPVSIGAEPYPHDIEKTLRARVKNVVFVDAARLASEAGSVKTVNTVLLGVMARHMGLDRSRFTEALGKTIAPRFLEMNLRAFENGYAAATESD